MLHYHYASPSHYRSCSLSFIYTLKHNAETLADAGVFPPNAIFDDEMFAHCGSERETEWQKDGESAAQRKGVSPYERLFSLSAPYCV